MVTVLEQLLLCHAMEELLDEGARAGRQQIDPSTEGSKASRSTGSGNPRPRL